MPVHRPEPSRRQALLRRSPGQGPSRAIRVARQAEGIAVQPLHIWLYPLPFISHSGTIFEVSGERHPVIV